ncbi:MAG: hypothetical protein KF831_05075 [Acidobacteria bacterium]|nr:hypothetical protein [Acidobacteriota bacterium]
MHFVKLRLRHNSIRMRLTRPEVEALASGTAVEESVAFGPGAEAVLAYGIECSDEASAADARFAGNRVVVSLPRTAAVHWAAGDEVSIEFTKMVGDGAELRVLIEKDFACLNPRRGEDEADMFPNPNAGTEC